VNVSTNAVNAVADIIDGISKSGTQPHRRSASAGGPSGASNTAACAASASTESAASTASRAAAATGNGNESARTAATGSSSSAANTPPTGASSKELDEWSDELLQTVLEQSIRDVAVAPASSGGDLNFANVSSSVSSTKSSSSDNSTGFDASTVPDISASSSASAAKIAPVSAPPAEPVYEVAVVKDVTYPKNSVVPVGSIFRKVWSIKNTGTTGWPFDTCVRVHSDALCACGTSIAAVVAVENGEKYQEVLFCDADIKIHVGAVEPGAETTVAITMNVGKKAIAKAKEAFGGGDFIRCVSAFCLTTIRRGLPVTTTPFEGDLLIMDIIVSDDGACNASCSTLLSTASSVSKSDTPSGSTKSGRMTDGWQMVTSSTNIFAANNGIAASADNNADDIVLSEVNAASSPAASGANSVAAVASESTANNDNDAFAWAYELQTLADMGFVDIDSLIPLLKEHIKTPKSTLLKDQNSATAAQDMRKNTEGMQHVVTALLGQSVVVRR